MPEITIPSTNTKFDPKVSLFEEANKLGVKPLVLADKKFSVDSQSNTLNSFSNIDASEYGKNTSLFGSDSEASAILNEQRAQNQGAGEQLLKGLGHLTSTVGTEILKVPGYIGGLVAAPAMEGSLIENIVDNAWVNAFEELDEGIKNQMPVYLTKEVQEGGIGRKLASSAWWATTGAEGIGFMLSMFAPGQALKALGVGAKLGKGIQAIAKESKLAKIITSEKFLKPTLNGLEMTSDGVSKIESTAAIALNTYIEAAAEGANTFDNVRKQYLQDNPDASDEEARKVASEAAANVVKANIGVLLLSNGLDELFLFKGFAGGAEKMAEKSVLGKIMKNGIIDVDEAGKLKRAGLKEFVKAAPLKIASNFAKEGLFEEGLQTKIQQHYEDVASGKTKASFTEDVLGNYFESLFNDPAMQEAVVLGGILGSGASMFSLASDIKQKNEMLYGREAYTPSAIGRFFGKKQKEATKGLVNIMNENFINSTRSIFDIAEKDADGNVIRENGKLKINETKLKDLVEQKEGLLLLNQLHNLAVLEGNKVEEEMLGDLLSFNYFMPFLQQDGGFELLNQHISNQLVDLMAKKTEDAGGGVPTEQDKEKLKTKLLSKAKEYKDIYDTVHKTTNTEFYIPVDNPQEYSGWKETVKNRKIQALVTHNSAQKSLNELNEKYPEGIDENTLPPDKFIEYKLTSKLKEEYQKRVNDAKETYTKLSSEKGLKEDYEKFNKQIQEDLKKTEEIVKEEAEKDEKIKNKLSSVNSLKAKASSVGYEENEMVLLEDDYGDRFKFNPSTGEVTNAFGKTIEDFEDMYVVPKNLVSKEQQDLEQLKTSMEVAEQYKEVLNTRQNYKEDFDVESVNNSIKDLINAVKTLYADRLNGKQGKTKKLFRLPKLDKGISELNKAIDTLNKRLEYLESLPLNDQTVKDKTIELLTKLVNLRNTLTNISKLSDISFGIAVKDTSLLNKLHQTFPNAPYLFNKIMDKKDANKVLGSKNTTLKNNVVTNFKDNLEDLDKALEIVNSVKDYSKSGEVFMSTPEGMDSKNYTYVTNLESDTLYEKLKDFDLSNDYFNDFHTALDEVISKNYHEVSEKVLEKTVHSSQKQDVDTAEITKEPADLDKIFAQKALPKTPFVTTGVSVKYDQQGKDVINNEGYPELTPFETQKRWFNTIDKYADTLQDYQLVPVTGATKNPELLAAIQSGFTNPSLLNDTDVFVFLVDKDGNFVKENGKHVFTSLRKPSTMFPENGMAKVAPDYTINLYLQSLGVPAVDSFEKIKNQKIGNFVLGKKARAKLKDLIDSDATGQTLLVLANEYAKEQYEAFINEILNNTDSNVSLKIEGVTKGYQLYRVDKNGKRIKNKIQDVFNNISFTNLPGTNQLKGGKIGVVVNADVKVGNEFLNLPKGTVYFQFDNNEVITLDSRTLNDKEVLTVIYLLSLADNNKDLNTITIPSKNGYTFNGKSIGKNIPVFFKKSKTNEQAFSLLETLINYGLRKDTKNKKGEIYIQSGKVVFTDFNGNLNEIPLSKLTEAIKNKNSSEIKPLVDFLKQKRFNVHNLLINNNPTFIYPIYENGKLTVNENRSYFEFMFNEVLTTTAMSKDGYPRRLQRNVMFDSKLTKMSKKAPVKHAENKPVALETSEKVTEESIINRQILGWKTQIEKLSPKEIKDILNHQLNNLTGFAELLIKIGIQPTEEHVNTIFNAVYDIKPKVPVLENKTKSIDDQIADQKADIERRRKESFEQITSPEDFKKLGLEQNKDEPPYSTTLDAGDENLEETLFADSKEKLIDKINAKYDAEIAALQNKTEEILKYKNIEVIDTENIVNAEGKKGAAQLDRDNNVIRINRKILKVKFEEKAWTKPRDLIEVIHGEKVTSAAQALPENQFSNYQEFENFVMEHEYQHSIYTREDFDKEFPNKTKGDYESEINNRALKELGLSEKITEQASLEKPKKLSAKEKLDKLKGEKKSITLSKTPTADKRIDNESLLDYYIKNNIVQKNCK